ncbi:Nif3-like dinuclear metal center hexameric protein, partial [Candidatus Margulisiibacteriota bacterium]
MKISTIISVMNRIAPPELACVTDQSNGLQIGSQEANVKKVVVTLDITEKAIKKAITEKAQLIIAHHPLFRITPDNIDPSIPLGQKIKAILENNIAIFVAHTNLDAAPQGVNYWLAKREGLDPEKCEIIEPTYVEDLCKLAIFIPKDNVDEVREAISAAGAGHIGKYSHCTFNAEGVGTFKPLTGAEPYVGKKGKLEKVEEIRLETIVPR